MTSLERKDLADEMTCGEGGHGRSMRHWTCDGKALLDVPAPTGPPAPPAICTEF